MGFIKELLARVEAAKYAKDKPEEDFGDDLNVWKLPDFYGPLDDIPDNRTEVYKTYGRAPKETENSNYPRAKMTVAENLPGTWNSKPRLYMLEYMEPYLREALRRCDELGVLDYITKMGCYNHRNINYNPAKPLSYHSWGAAVDIEGDYNKIKRGNIPPPFSKQWIELYPDGIPYEMVLAFKSVGFTWGGDWNRSSWESLVKNEGVGYDSKGAIYMSYTDPMHFQLVRE